MTVFLLIRHGMTDMIGKVMVGRSPGIHLNQEGKRQAESLAERLMKVELDAIFTSPLERAIETARPFAERHNLPLIPCEALTEVGYGEWTGASKEEMYDDPLWNRYNRFRSQTAIPEGEHPMEIQVRIVKKMHDLSNRFPGRTIALVSHGDVIRSALVYFCAMPIDFILRLRIDPASVSAVSISGYEPEIICINNTGGVEF